MTQLDFYQEHTQSLMTPTMRKAVEALRQGLPIVLLDAQDRENEADLVIAAEKIDAASMNFLIQQGSGIVCLALPKNRLAALGLEAMVAHNTNIFSTAFTVSIEACHGISTGVSAKDRATTVKVAIAEDTKPADLARPGHVFPLASASLGVFERMGHTEGSLDLMTIAGLNASAVLCDVMNPDGSMLTGTERETFAYRHNIPAISLEEILFHRIKTEDIFEHNKKILSDSRFGKLVWHRFNFWGQELIDIFMRLEDAARPKQRLSIIAIENLYQRYMASIINSFEDDSFASALKNLVEQNCDVVVVVSDSNLKIKAALCRALLVLDITHIDPNLLSEEFLGVSRNFGFNYGS